MYQYQRLAYMYCRTMELLLLLFVCLNPQAAWCSLMENDVLYKYTQQTRPNVLFIIADDMRPQIGAYGADQPSPVTPKMHTPNLDKLAAQSFVARRAHVQYAMCGPSRTSLLTSRRPDTTHVYDNLHYFRKVGGNFTTLPQYFKQEGYVSVGMGKIFHPGESASGGDDPPSWSRPYWHPSNEKFWWKRTHSWISVTSEQRKQFPLPDEQTAEHAVKTLRDLAPKAMTGEAPFFLAVGFLKPHLPFVFPEEFLQYYPSDTMRLPDNGYAPVDMPNIAWNSYYELRTYHDIASLNVTGAMNTSLPDPVIHDLRRAYYSALSYTDHLIGVVIDEVKQLGLHDNTIIAFLGDHGWQLGEHGEWCKQTNFELSTHAPLMLSVPGVTTGAAHQPNDQLIEFVDIFPTLAELAGLPNLQTCPTKGSNHIPLCTEGQSFVPLIKRHDDKGGLYSVKRYVPWKLQAFSQFRRFKGDSEVMGYTMRTGRYRYTEWVHFWGAPTFKPKWSKVYGVELYDHLYDPEENNNVATNPGYSGARRMLRAALHKGWQGGA